MLTRTGELRLSSDTFLMSENADISREYNDDNEKKDASTALRSLANGALEMGRTPSNIHAQNHRLFLVEFF